MEEILRPDSGMDTVTRESSSALLRRVFGSLMGHLSLEDASECRFAYQVSLNRHHGVNLRHLE